MLEGDGLVERGRGVVQVAQTPRARGACSDRVGVAGHGRPIASEGG
jgi:hypothetical protein